MREHRSRRTVLVMAVAALAGCAQAPSASEEGGQASIQFMGQPPPPKPAQEKAVEATPRPGDEIFSAQPIGKLVKPLYPAGVRAGAVPVTVGVSIKVDTAGRVSEIGPSFVCFSTPGPFAAEFRAAVEAAIAQWRFHPGEIRHLELVKDPGGDFLRVGGSEKVEWGFDVSFTFVGPGDVRGGAR